MSDELAHDREARCLHVRLDRVRFRVTGHEAIDFDYAAGRYAEGRGAIDCDFGSIALSPRIGAVFRAGRAATLYAGVSTGTQTPTIGELTENPELGLTRVLSSEIGLKLRHPALTLDAAAFWSPVRGEIVQVVEPHGTTGYVNAGRTDKTGFTEDVLGRAPYDALRRWIFGVDFRLRGIDYDIVEERLDAQDADYEELTVLNRLAGVHAFVELT